MNPNKGERAYILEKLRENGGYCPCSLVKNEDTRCMCKVMKERNECECGLYVREDVNGR